VQLITLWLLGKNDRKAFAEKFGDSKWLTEAKDPVLYSDVGGLKPPGGLRAVPYDFAQARMRRLRSGARAGPVVLVTRSVAEEPAEEGVPRIQRERRAGDARKDVRYYYVEVGIGNQAWHWMKVAVGERDGKLRAEILWRKVS
jgi:hypothetical protein